MNTPPSPLIIGMLNGKNRPATFEETHQQADEINRTLDSLTFDGPNGDDGYTNRPHCICHPAPSVEEYRHVAISYMARYYPYQFRLMTTA